MMSGATARQRCTCKNKKDYKENRSPDVPLCRVLLSLSQSHRVRLEDEPQNNDWAVNEPVMRLTRMEIDDKRGA